MISRKFPDALSGLLAASLALAFVARAAQADNGGGSSLEDYFKRVGYLPIELKRGEHDKLLAQGVLAGKKRLFLVDTGCGRTVLDESAARGLKSRGELGVTLEDGFLGKLSDPSLLLMDKLTSRPFPRRCPLLDMKLAIRSIKRTNWMMPIRLTFSPRFPVA